MVALKSAAASSDIYIVPGLIMAFCEHHLLAHNLGSAWPDKVDSEMFEEKVVLVVIRAHKVPFTSILYILSCQNCSHM